MDSFAQKNQAFLQRLIGLEIGAVTFVRTYVQLQLEGDLDWNPVLSIFTQPNIRQADSVIEWGQPGFRDALCDNISHTVTSVEYVADESSSILFDGGWILRIPFVARVPSGPEVLTLTYGDELLVIR